MYIIQWQMLIFNHWFYNQKYAGQHLLRLHPKETIKTQFQSLAIPESSYRIKTINNRIRIDKNNWTAAYCGPTPFNPSQTRRKPKTIISHNRKYRLELISTRASICSAIKYWRPTAAVLRDTTRRGCIIPRIWFTTYPPEHPVWCTVSPCIALHVHKLWILGCESGAIGYNRDLLSLWYVPLRIAPRFIGRYYWIIEMLCVCFSATFKCQFMVESRNLRNLKCFHSDFVLV